MSADALKALRTGGRVAKVYYHEGRPGGKNNDCVVLTMESGERVRFDSYAMSGMTVEIARRGN